MTDLKDALSKHFDDDEVVDAVATIIKAGKSYGEGDALAGVKISGMQPEEFDRLTELFQEAGFDVKFSNYMGVVGFATSPETHDEELNEAIENL